MEFMRITFTDFFCTKCQNIYLLYNALGSGVNTGEKQDSLKLKWNLKKIEHIIIENTSDNRLIKTDYDWKKPSVLRKIRRMEAEGFAITFAGDAYLYNPIDFIW